MTTEKKSEGVEVNYIAECGQEIFSSHYNIMDFCNKCKKVHAFKSVPPKEPTFVTYSQLDRYIILTIPYQIVIGIIFGFFIGLHIGGR